MTNLQVDFILKNGFFNHCKLCLSQKERDFMHDWLSKRNFLTKLLLLIEIHANSPKAHSSHLICYKFNNYGRIKALAIDLTYRDYIIGCQLGLVVYLPETLDLRLIHTSPQVKWSLNMCYLKQVNAISNNCQSRKKVLSQSIFFSHKHWFFPYINLISV